MAAAFFHQAGVGLGFVGVGLLCAAGMVLSCLSISGTWLVVAAALLAAALSGSAFPGWGTLVLFVLLAVAVEVLENVAGFWGVKRRGGSGLAGFMALAGGLLGLVLGTWIPVPVVGSLLGMLAGSFALVFAVERHRLQKDRPAAHVAWGAVMARVSVIFLKVGVTLGMIIWLAFGLIMS